MRTRTHERVWQRVVLRSPIPATLGEQAAIVIELGAQGAKVEHADRLPVGSAHTLRIGSLEIPATVRHSTLLPASTSMVLHTGVEFDRATPSQSEAIYGLLLEEAEAQVREWEANLNGIRVARPAPQARSSVARRFIWLRLTESGWRRSESRDPNQPIDGVAVMVDETEEAIALLCRTYENADQRSREYLRRCAALAILESLQQG